MKTKLLNIWESLKTNFWFVPTLMATTSVVLATLLINLDAVIQTDLTNVFSIFYTGSPDGAREVLGVIAGSMITVAGVVFSITMVALTLASNQFGPRLLRNFMRDTGNKIVLGTFISTFIYCLIVMRTIRGNEGDEFVPHVAVTFGVVLALAGIGVLIYFIHHASASIQADRVVTAVYDELNEGIKNIFPEHSGANPDEASADIEEIHLPEEENRPSYSIQSEVEGYIQAVNSDGLMKIAMENGLVLQLSRRPGKFVPRGGELVRIWPEEHVTERMEKSIRKAFIIGHQRTPEQDVEFSMNQLVEVAVRSLSPSLNDPFTAIICLDYLGAALCQIAERPIPSRYRFDDQGNLRVIADSETFSGMMDAALNQIRQNGIRSVAVTVRLLETLEQIARKAERNEQRIAVWRHAVMVLRAAEESLQEVADLDDVRERYQALADILGEKEELEVAGGVE
ncbi:MAG: DUF2254 domain-containing protein [Candidatus Zixiibacteriota bacterium]|nr:MAG: DUF2254 domain-containing protein [candidate division Zixibacteria bacterium]